MSVAKCNVNISFTTNKLLTKRKKEMKNYKLSLLLAFFILLTACSKEDFEITDTVDPDPTASVDVQDFMWKAMNYWYFWQDDVTNLADDAFPNTTEGSEAYTNFLLSEDNPEDFFKNQLTFTEDRFSIINSDYRVLTQASAGIRKSNGLKFGLVKFSGSDDVFGFVRYIVPNSNATLQDISRGDIFTGVNGTTLNVNNTVELLGNDVDTYTLNMADVVGNEITDNGKEVMLTKEEGLQEDPILIDKIFEIEGKRIGYLMYNQFLNEFDEQLNQVFGRFKAGGVTDLVLDLRYNPGGSVNTTVLLGSMIYGTNTNDVFLRARYNDKLQQRFESGSGDTRDFFKNKTPGNADLNSLNLSRVYVLTSSGSASASELIINGLDPYLQVIQIGDTTRGKNEFSVILVDDRANSLPYLFNPERVNEIKSGNDWAIRPLIGRNENSIGFSDFTSGMVPEIALKEDVTNLGVLGDENEPLLARAIQEILGATSKRDFTVKMPADVFLGSEMFTPMQDDMWVDSLPEIPSANE